jgi:hypothetical protein
MPRQEGVHPFVDLSEQATYLALGQAASARGVAP